MKFKTDIGDVRIIHVELTNDKLGEVLLIFTFDNGDKSTIPCDINMDYITVVKKMVKKKHDT